MKSGHNAMKIQMKYWIRQLFLMSCILISLGNVSLASADTTRETEILLNWAENNYPQYFPSHQPTQQIDSWLFRFYPETNIYAGVNTSDNGVYTLGGPWGNDNPAYIDNLPNFLQTVGNGKLTDVIAIVTNGSNFSTALKSDGSVWEWGNRAGLEAITIPLQVGGLTDVSKLVSGELATIALKNDGTVWAWGDNSRGDLGDGTKINRQTSVDLVAISGLTDVIAIGESGAFSPSYSSSGLYAITQDGKLWVWGCLANEILDDSTIYPPSCPDSPRLPAIIEGLTDVINFKSRRSSSANNYYVLKRDGTVWAWGDNSYGQLGDGTTTARKTPTQAVELSDVIDIAIDQGIFEKADVPLKISVFVLRQDGTVWAWGNNDDNPLGVGSTASYVSVPTLIAGLTGIKKLAIGPYHKLALRNEAQFGHGDITMVNLEMAQQ